MMVFHEDGIMSMVGNTPLLPLRKVVAERFRVFAKLEGFNPGGSIKDRPALAILRNGIEQGKIDKNTTVVESSSGNMGIALAQFCRVLGLRFICVVDSRTTTQNVELLKTYGAEVELISEPDPISGELLQARINRAKQITESIPNSFLVNQYANLYNAIAHHKTMEEIVHQLNGEIDYLFCAASSCGTLRGCAEYLAEKNITRTRIYAVDAVGSVIFGGKKGKRLIPGHGSGITPILYKEGLAHRQIAVSDFDCVAGCRRLLEREGLLAGGSSGAAFMGFMQTRDEIPPGATCVILFPDRGDRYLDTIFSDAWVTAQFGNQALERMRTQWSTDEGQSFYVRKAG